MYKLFIFTINILFSGLAIGQETIELSNNNHEGKINIKGTYLSIDTSGLNLKTSASPRTFIDEKDKTVFNIEQKQVSLEDYESLFINKMLKLDTILQKDKIRFNDFKGNLIVSKVNLDNTEKSFWLCYLGNSKIVIEIKVFYNIDLEDKYKKAFYKAIKSIYIDTSKKISIYEDLPYYLDEEKFPYKKEFSFMPQSISISKDINGSKRIITITYTESNKDEINELKKAFGENIEKSQNEGKEIFTSIQYNNDKIKLKGLIVYKNQIINLVCISSSSDKEAIDEFKEIAKSITFK